MLAMPDDTGAARRQGLAQRRKAVGLTQEQLAEQLGVERTTVVRWERGETQPQPWLRPKLAQALRVSADRIEELLAPGGAPTSPQDGAAVVPRQLPTAVAAFTGRAAELAALDRLLLGPHNTSAAVISAVSGTAGVGKTALALRWAHQAAHRFPDGQLYLNLRGYDPDQPMLATDALAGFLYALGAAGPDIPPDESDRAARYRSLLADKRMLIVLDNAGTVEQVRPLLPGHPHCRVVVTSRDSLAGLVARDGAQRLDVDLLPIGDAVALLRELVGPRVDDDTDAAATLAEQCARLPLALRVAAELAATQPDVPLIELVAELSDEQQRLDVLSVGGDPHTAVRSVFSWSYSRLDHDAARAFRLSGLHPGQDFDSYAAAALTESTLDATGDQLGTLIRAHLIQATGPGRYGMHDLLRAYAREQAAAGDADDPCDQAQDRLFDYYGATAAAAMDALFPAEAHLRPRVPPSDRVMPPVADDAAGQAWLDSERANLVAVVVHCTGHGWPRHATNLPGTLFRYLMTGSHLPEAHTIYTHALQAARRSGNPAAEAEALNGLGGICVMNGRVRDAADNYRAALERYRQCGDRAGQARALANLGITELRLHSPRPAADYLRQAIAAFEEAEDSIGTARGLVHLAEAETGLGSYDEAAEHLQRALVVLHAAKQEFAEAEALENLGDLSLRRGQLTQAADFYGQALAICRRIGRRVGVAAGISNLGEVGAHRRQYREAIASFQQALALFRQAGDQHGEAVTRRRLARALHGVGQPAAARAELEMALRVAAETGDPYQLASAHRDLAASHHSAGEDGQARDHWQQALTLYTPLGVPEAQDVAERLLALDSDQSANA
jgi:tetratricopeptide (TPR) repeat protein/transcriptional regulator with XRE-family HTH domain